MRRLDIPAWRLILGPIVYPTSWIHPSLILKLMSDCHHQGMMMTGVFLKICRRLFTCKTYVLFYTETYFSSVSLTYDWCFYKSMSIWTRSCPFTLAVIPDRYFCCFICPFYFRLLTFFTNTVSMYIMDVYGYHLIKICITFHLSVHPSIYLGLDHRQIVKMPMVW